MEGGGAERQVTYLARELIAAGCELHVAITRGGENMARLEASGAAVHQLGPCRNHDPRVGIRLARTIAAIQPDLVQCWLLQMELLGGLASLLTGTPWIFGERSSAAAYPRTLKNTLRVWIASSASGIVSNSAAGNEYWQVRTRTSTPRYVVSNALPLDEIEAAAPASPQEMGTQLGQFTVLHAGRLDRAKNAAALVSALAQLPDDSHVHALLCGTGPARTHIEQLVAQQHLGDRVRVAGYATNLWSLMKRASAFVSLSRFEGSPNVVLEAMACGCPLIVSDIAAHRELLDETAAILVPSEAPHAVADAIETLKNDPAGAVRRAAIARRRAQQHAAPLIAQQYLAVYRDVLSRRSHRPQVAL